MIEIVGCNNQIFMATETWHIKEDAGTESNLNLTINVNGSNIVDQNIAFQEPLKEALLFMYQTSIEGIRNVLKTYH